MKGIFETVSQVFAFTAAIITTLQAGSRALYAVSHDNELGVMDGPLILSPFDVKELERRNEEGEVSPLWEITFGFSEAVRLLHNVHQNDSDCHSDMKTTSLSKLRKRSACYSFASPHKAFIYEEEVVSSTDLNTNIFCDGDGTNKTSTQSLIVATQDTKMILPKEYKTFQKIKSPKSSYSYLLDYINRVSSQAKIYISMFHFDPIVQFKSARRTPLSSETNKSDDEMGLKLDYDGVESSTVPIPNDYDDNFEGKNTTKVAHIKAFAPLTFQKLRSRFGVQEDEFIKSMLDSGPYVSFQSNSKGAARAGGFFFFTRDGAYMVKTIKKAEIKAILDMLPKYYKFMRRNAKRSLLTRFCGLYSVQIDEVSGKGVEDECVFLIMNSVFPAEGSKFISERFDLKGSTVGRECSLEERQERGNQAVLKDLDLEREVNVIKKLPPSFGLSEYGISIGPEAKSALLSQLRRDLNLLVSCSVMDYSLLVGVVNLECSDSEAKFKRNLPAKVEIEKVLNHMSGSRHKKVFSLAAPVRQIIAPGICVGQILYNSFSSTLSSIFTPPFPFYGAGACGVDGGTLSVLAGKRLGRRALYYIGVIDFLQPWTTQKVLEKELKGIMGYEKTAISCAHPKDYAERFLEYLDKHIT